MNTSIKKRVICVLAVCIFGLFWYYAHRQEVHSIPNANIDAFSEADLYVAERAKARTVSVSTTDPFGDDNMTRILLIGLDSRAGETEGHCDAIQLFEIDRARHAVSLIAVPRGTWSPLPGMHLSSSYYVSNACAIAGLEYGINRIEKILGKKADYVVVVGFSQTMGILRNLNLPATDTLRWLRHRQGYALGEPQRARNHSTFLKEMLVKYIPQDPSLFDNAKLYVGYRLVRTDLSFDQVRQIMEAIRNMNLADYPERVTLAMKPAYPVQDIPFEPERVAEYLDSVLDPIKHLLSLEDYREITDETVEERLLHIIAQQSGHMEFVKWAFEHNLWLQLENEQKREEVQFELTSRYADLEPSLEIRRAVLADYILEKEVLGFDEWAVKGKKLLQSQL